jgi:DNA-binding SARP family transcriptional activator
LHYPQSAFRHVNHKEETDVFSLSVHLLGKFSARRNDCEISGLDASKLQEMFGYLLLNRSRPHSRESLATLLWGESSTSQSKKYLRQALWHIQSALNYKSRANDPPFLDVDTEWIRVNTRANLWLDVATFEQVAQLTQGVRGNELNAEQARMLKETVRLYRGDLLEGCYQEWCLFERERLQNLFLSMLDKLMLYCEIHQEFEDGVNYGNQILRCDRAREHTHRRIMRLHCLMGNRTAALRQYEKCARVLAEELNVEPAQKTSRLYEQIRDDQPVYDHLPAPPAADLTPDNGGSLEQIRNFLLDLQQQINKQIQSVEKALKKH